MNTKWLFKISAIVFPFLIIGLGFLGCSKPGGRGDRYAGGGAYIGSNPAVSPDGSKIVFGSPRDGSGNIYILNSDGTNVRQLTSKGGMKDSPQFSPDGSKIVFLQEGPGGRSGKIKIINADGSDLKTISKIY